MLPSDHGISDFRSDTVTQPDEEMREVMARAEVGDDVFGDDPTIRKLEDTASSMFGMEAGLFVPSGTMGNLIALKIHCQPGDEIIAEKKSHIYNCEGGGSAWIAGVQVNSIYGPEGRLDPAEVKAAVRAIDPHYPRSRLLCLENTHNFYGGRVVPLDHLHKLRDVARSHDLAVHIDGARIMNAAVASGTDPVAYGAIADTIQCCLSKGLGAPIGSVLLGSRQLIDHARFVRKALGGGMRQAGIVAAAGLLALEQGPKQMVVDHQNAKRLAQGLSEIDNLIVDIDACETNILFVKIDGPSELHQKLVDELREQKVWAIALGDLGIRFVTHKHIIAPDVDRAVALVREILPRLLAEHSLHAQHA